MSHVLIGALSWLACAPALRTTAGPTDPWLTANEARYTHALDRARGWLEPLEVDPVALRARGIKGKKKLTELVDVCGSVRQQEEAQCADEYCQTCHSQMDPIGWSLHGFDADGSERLVDEMGFEIDDLAVWNGVTFDGPKGMVDAIVADARLQQCAVEKTFTYALGRGVRIEDGPMIEAMTAEFINGGQSFEALATAIVTSDAFRLRGVPEVE